MTIAHLRVDLGRALLDDMPSLGRIRKARQSNGLVVKA